MEIVEMIIDFVDDREICCKCQNKFDEDEYHLCETCDSVICHECQIEVEASCPDKSCYYCSRGHCI